MASYKKLVKRLPGILKWAVQRWDLALLLVAMLFILTTEGPPPGELSTQINHILAGERFDFAKWEIKAMLNKLAHTLVSPQRYMDEPARHDFFLDYLELVSNIQQTEWEIHRAHTDPAIQDPDAATATLHTQLDRLRATEKINQPLAEAILEEQVSYILVSEGFGLLRQELPPVGVHFTPLPALLIVSPRDHIERVFSLGLRHGLDATQREAIETQVDDSQDTSSLVSNIGGLSAYPAMLLESSSLNWVAEVTAHEWLHHYLMLLPLGRDYAAPETRIINETVASIVGKEAGRSMIARYYPEFLPPEPQEQQEPEEPQEDTPPPEPPAFDYQAEMRETRVGADELLAEGEIEQAEAYMEERRQEFVANGYYIRKLNQAYFAFHGAYADKPGAAGEDPIGPAVQELRAHSPDLYTFASRIAYVTTLAELEALLAE